MKLGEGSSYLAEKLLLSIRRPTPDIPNRDIPNPDIPNPVSQQGSAG